ncbi:PREDICTED: gamma-taxilin [Papilio polytes]|uniref:gamma-taxilin n=1 Tax=Papilio polytes TaxID=76194 RepID=UPI00067601E1|nr:PREDICTED: gamma-taxilin [Papilio polytes]
MEVAAEESPKDNTVSENNIGDCDKLPTPLPHEPQKKSKKEDRSKKDEKNVEQFMKTLSSVPTLDEKFSLVCKKYTQAADDNKKMQFYIKQSDKRYALLVKEKEQLQHEYNKTVLVKSKLENLCRELQKQNKAIKEESLLKIREEEERRKETQAKFQNTLSEITNLLQQNNEKSAKLRDDNISMTEKFKSLMQQHQIREQQIVKMTKQMGLESELSDAKMQKASLEHQAEKERLVAEIEQMKMTLAQYRAKVMEMQTNETALKGQLAVYTDKYDEFQTALVKSNQLFGGFKEQMDKMSKKIQKLEKESLSWKKRWESSQTALLDMCGERQASEERAAAAARQLQRMQGLCRTLQAERTALLGTLKEHNIERPPLPATAPSPPPAPAAAPAAHHTHPPHPADNNKVEAMAANCEQLRQSLAHLQTQLDVLTTANNEPVPEKVKTEKQKKSKSKKSKKQAAEKVDVKETESDSSAPKDATDESKTNEANEQRAKKIDETMNSLLLAINEVEVKEIKNDTEVKEVKKDEVEAVLNSNEKLEDEISTEVAKLTDVKEDIIAEENVSQVELSSNEEIAHLEEVKSISKEA